MMYGPDDIAYEDTLEALLMEVDRMPGYPVWWIQDYDRRDAGVTALVEMCQTLDEANEVITFDTPRFLGRHNKRNFPSTYAERMEFIRSWPSD